MKSLLEFSGQGRRLRNLVILTGALVPICLILAGLRLGLNEQALSAEWKIGLLAAVALVFLILAGFGLGLLLNRAPLSFLTGSSATSFSRLLRWWQSRDRSAGIYQAACLSLAYLVPIILFQLPVWLKMSWLHIPAREWFSTWGLASGMPWLFIWQAVCISLYPLGMRFFYRQDFRSGLRLPRITFAAALLAGLGLALAAIFLVSIETAGNSLESPPLDLSQQVVLVLVALGIAPWAEELAFRGQNGMGLSLQPQNYPITIIRSLVYATLLFRPLFWLPAFLLSLGLFELSRRSRSLLPAILAHLVFNAVALFFGWWKVL